MFTLSLTFDRLINGTSFVADMRRMLTTLHEAYTVPVDVEFTVNFLADGTHRINLVQCRPFQVRAVSRGVDLPEHLSASCACVDSRGPIIGSGRAGAVDRLVYVVPGAYGSLGDNDRYAVARTVGRLTHLDREKQPVIMLLGPGRWGTSSPSLGVPVTFAEIDTVGAICELALMHEGLVPDVSLGTHFFNDLVEADIAYIAVYPSRQGYLYNEKLLASLPNRLTELLPDAAKWAQVIRVIDPPAGGDGGLVLNVNPLQQRAVLYREEREGERENETAR